AKPAVLTDQALQPIVAQAANLWRASGIDTRTLSALDHMTVQVATLNHAELGWTLGNDVWIDQTAAGWGWSFGAAVAPERIDLLTVVTHELGHVLGFGDDAGPTIMATVLSPGVRRAPEASHVTGSSGLTANSNAIALHPGAPLAQNVDGFVSLNSLLPSQPPPAVLDRSATSVARATSMARDLPTVTTTPAAALVR